MPPPPGAVQVIPQISQETFDQVVTENIDDFEMDPEEAVTDAISQFESQGVDLSNIRCRAPTDGPEPVMVQLLAYTELIAAGSSDPTKVKEVLESLTGLFKDKAVRLHAGMNGGLPIMLSGCEKYAAALDSEAGPDCRDLLLVAADGLNGLVYENPDLLGSVQQTCLEATSGETASVTPELARVIRLAETTKADGDLTAKFLKCCRYGCFMHESNRQALVKGGMIQLCLAAAETHYENDAAVTQALQGLKALTKDDDPRVPFGKANEHTMEIAKQNNGLERLLQVLGLCYKGKDPKASIAAGLFSTLSQLAARDEFCKKIVDLGCLDFVLPALEKFMDNESVAYAACCLLRAVAGNDEVKKIIGSRGGIALIIETMQKQVKSTKVCEQGAAALSAVTLKTPANATAIAEAEGAHILVKIMYVHPEAEKLQRQACMAIRNMVVRNPELIDGVLGQGAENAINVCLQKHKTCTDEAKAALRDLKCKVHLVERWTGDIGKNSGKDIDGSIRKF